MANTTVNTLLKSLGQIALATIASYGAAKLSSSETSWNAYRNQMVQSMAATALTAAIQQYTAATTGVTTEGTTESTVEATA